MSPKDVAKALRAEGWYSKGTTSTTSSIASGGCALRLDALEKRVRLREHDRYDTRELLTLCETILEDGELTYDELYKLAEWLNIAKRVSIGQPSARQLARVMPVMRPARRQCKLTAFHPMKLRATRMNT